VRVLLDRMGNLANASTRTKLHRSKTPDGVLTWSANARLTMRHTRHGLASCFELDGEPLTVFQGRAIKRRYGIVD
jgi:hypothetical protein